MPGAGPNQCVVPLEQLVSKPQYLRAWLPRVTQLVCPVDAELLPLIQGLGPGLRTLDLSYPTCYDHKQYACLAGAVGCCQQLQHISLHYLTQQLLDALVQLPVLSHVRAHKVLNVDKPRGSNSSSGWQELRKVCDGRVDQVAELLLARPLQSHRDWWWVNSR